MNLLNFFSYLLLIQNLLFFSSRAFSRENEQDRMTEAIQLYEKGNYNDAETLFEDILNSKPDDVMVNYYYGACRTENYHFSDGDLECLIKANAENVPAKINYYFGMQYHARSNWERALKFYNRFNSTDTLPDAMKQKLLLRIQQCYDKINPFEEYMTVDNEEVVYLTEPDSVFQDSVQPEEALITSRIQDSENDRPLADMDSVPESFIDEEIEFPVNAEITYLNISHFKTKEGESLFKQGKQKQIELDKTSKDVETLRDKYNKANTSTEKKLLGEDILAMENLIYSLKKESSTLLLRARMKENEYWKNAPLDETEQFILKLETIRNERISEAVAETDSVELVDTDILMESSNLALPPEEEKETDLIYKIQIGAYSKGLPSYVERLFKKLSLIRKIENYTDENGIVVYTTGNLTNFEDAVRMQNQVRQEGVEDAFVVPYFKGKRITLKEAKELEAKK